VVIGEGYQRYTSYLSPDRSCNFLVIESLELISRPSALCTTSLIAVCATAATQRNLLTCPPGVEALTDLICCLIVFTVKHFSSNFFSSNRFVHKAAEFFFPREC
jgi:hypothetical protein